MNFQQKYGPWALVAGASEGLGAAFAESLAKRGSNLILIARRKEMLARLAKDLREQYKVDIQYQSLDLARTELVQAYIEQLTVDIGLLVYNAAYAPIGYFKDIAVEELLKITAVNVQTPLLMVKLLSGKMINQGKGGIVLMSSLSGTQGSPKIATYAASKAFNTILAEGLWRELKAEGIDVIASVAGAIRTPGYQTAQNSKEAPGIMNPSEVAEHTLAALGKKPTVIPGKVNQLAQFVMNRLLPRKLAISIIEKNTKDLA